MTEQQKRQLDNHNKQVVKHVIISLVESNMADPIRLLTDTNYASQMIYTYLEASNLVRESMNLPPLVIYDIKD